MATKKNQKNVQNTTNKKNIKQGDVITIRDVGPGSVVAAGRNASASISTSTTDGQLAEVFTPLLAVIQDAPEAVQPRALEQAQQLQDEISKCEGADDSRIAKLVDGIVGLVPGAVSAVASMFASPILAGLVGPVTKFVLEKITEK